MNTNYLSFLFFIAVSCQFLTFQLVEASSITNQRIKLRKKLSVQSIGKVIDSLQFTRQRYNALNYRTPRNPSVISLVNVDDSFYYADVTVGTPPQSFKVGLDTGSSDFWLPSVLSNQTHRNPNTYNASASSTYVANGTSIRLHYGSGSAAGFLSTDAMTFGEAPITNQTFAEITSESLDIQSLPYDGLMGLGYPSLSKSGATSPLQNLISQGQLSPGIFAFWLNPDPTSPNGGEMTFGGTNAAHYTGDITWVPVTVQRYWQFKVDSVQVCFNQPFSTRKVCVGQQRFCPSSGCQMIADTGTSLIVGPPAIVNQINLLIGSFYGTGGVSLVNCRSVSRLPDITITIGGTPFTLTSQQYVQKVGTNTCISSFVPMSFSDLNGSPLWILGNAFLNQFYSVFDYDNHRVGFAPAIGGTGDEVWDNYKRKLGLFFGFDKETDAKFNFFYIHQSITAHNNDPNYTYKLRHNRLSHLSNEEQQFLTGANIALDKSGAMMIDPTELLVKATLPNSVDLRTNRCMQPVKDQGQCGSCYAFSAVTVMEFAFCIRRNTPISFSDQQIVDCSSSYGNYGCNGGWPTNVWKYIANSKTIFSSSSYPYRSGTTKTPGTCKATTTTGSQSSTTATSYAYLPKNNVDAIKTVLASNRLVAAVVNANDNFKHYASGIFTASASSCNPSAINHAVTIVGYGTSSGIPYWIVRNSWGTWWGSKGYILMRSGVNTCGIESYPMVSSLNLLLTA